MRRSSSLRLKLRRLKQPTKSKRLSLSRKTTPSRSWTTSLTNSSLHRPLNMRKSTMNLKIKIQTLTEVCRRVRPSTPKE